MGEKKLLKKIKDGDPEAFRELYDKFSKELLNFSYYYVKNIQAAEDIVQDVFINIWKKSKNLDPDLSIKSYLFKAVQNHSLNYLRHEKTINEKIDSILDFEETSLSENAIDEEFDVKTFVENAINQLPEKCREIFNLGYTDGLTNPEIAQKLDISINTVKTQKSRAYKFLKKQLHNFLSLLYL